MGKKIICFTLLCIITVSLTGCASCQRWRKSVVSEVTNGIDRTVTVYDYNGNVLKSYTGKFDVTESESEVYFDDEDGKRIIIHGGIIINEEN